MKYLEDFVCGERQTVGEHLLNELEIITYASSWDPQFFHTDPQKATDSVFKGLVAAGTHLMAISVLKLVGQQPPVAVIAGLGWDEVRFLAPGRPGDRLRLERECVEVRPSSSRPDRGVVRSQLKLFNQNGDLLLSYIDAVLVARRPAEQAA